MNIEQIDPTMCPFNLQGENIAYLSRGKMRGVAKDLGVSPDGVKLELYKRLVFHLTRHGVAEIKGLAQVTIPR